MAHFFLCSLIICTFILATYGGSGGSLADQRIKTIQRKVSKIERWLKLIEQKRTDCNDTIVSVSRQVKSVAGLVGHLYKGPLLAKMNLANGRRNYDQVLLKLPDAMEECLDSYRGTQVYGYQAEITCLQQILWRYDEPYSARKIRRIKSAVRRFRTRINDFRPRPRIRYRKEYRTLTDSERQKFHNALNALYEDGTIQEFAELHDYAQDGGHGGPAFLPWHRVFITRFENALREKDPDVTLPYWDSTMDNKRENPANSKLWTHSYLGNGAGDVITGDFKHWTTNQGDLYRAYGGPNTRLISHEDVENIMSKCYFEDISLPFGPWYSLLEVFHADVHVWVGGSMGDVGTAPYDPVFYLHHCFVDYLWEKFRENQKENCGVDPEFDYPDLTGQVDPDLINHHRFTSNMLGMEEEQVSYGMEDFWTNTVYRYIDSPTCENQCGQSSALFCDYITNCCIPRGRIDGPSKIRALPLPGMTPPPDDISKLFASREYRSNEELYDEVQPGYELAIIAGIVPTNGGRKFHGQPGDGRSLWTMKEDMEGYQKKVKAFEAAKKGPM